MGGKRMESFVTNKELNDVLPESKLDLCFSPQELKLIADAVFGKGEELSFDGTYIAKFWIKTFTGAKDVDDVDLEGWQKILVAPMSGVTGLVELGVNLFNKETYADIYSSVAMLKDEKTRTILIEILKKGWENCTQEEQIAVVVELVYSSLLTFNAINKIPLKKLLVLKKAMVKLKGKRALNVLSKISSQKSLGTMGQFAGKVVEKVSGAVGKTGKLIIASPLDDAVYIGGAVVTSSSPKTKDMELEV
ncbi:hypothetical protein KJ632_01095 [Patescibacteria group bacterium]|nr:hypothetical protein [Patescibacteria group bacterium]